MDVKIDLHMSCITTTLAVLQQSLQNEWIMDMQLRKYRIEHTNGLIYYGPLTHTVVYVDAGATEVHERVLSDDIQGGHSVLSVQGQFQLGDALRSAREHQLPPVGAGEADKASGRKLKIPMDVQQVQPPVGESQSFLCVSRLIIRMRMDVVTIIFYDQNVPTAKEVSYGKMIRDRKSSPKILVLLGDNLLVAL